MTESRAADSRPGWWADEPEHPAASGRRRAIGVGFGILAGATVVMFTLGVWNPWRLVVLHTYAGNPSAGVVWLLAFSLVAVWLLIPPSRWLWPRVLVAVLLALSLGFYGLFGMQFFAGDQQVVATSADGQRALVRVSRFGGSELRIWAGTGLSRRDAGYLGIACGAVVGSFKSRDSVHVASAYGEFDRELDPVTGRPLATIGPTCSG